MSDFFCDNPACPCHVEVAEGLNAMKFVTHNGATVTSRRFKVVVPQDEKTLWFCSSCVNVVSLINNK